MEWMAGSNFRLSLVVLLAVSSCGSGEQGGAHSLSSILSVSASGPPWCEFQGTIKGTPFFHYSCNGEMAKRVILLGMRWNDTETCNQWREHEQDLLEEFQKALLENEKNISKAFDSLALQGSLMCEQKSSGCHKMFWKFGFKGQMCLRFDLKNRSWTELHPGCRSLKKTLESDRYVTNLLVLVSNGDCVKLLNQSTVLDTKAALITAPAKAPVPSKAVIIKDNIALILTPIFILITLGI